jgi:nucleotide-binding universal stress UspA family protein
MKALELERLVAIKNILFATDFEAPASRALPFAVALANRHRAKLYAVHVIPQEAYALASSDSVDRILKETRDYAVYALNQIASPLRQHGLRCGVLVGEGNVPEVIEGFMHTYAADLLCVGTSSRAGLGKVLLGSVAEELIRESPCPVLTVGPGVTTLASAGIHHIVCATDFSPASARATKFAFSLADEYEAHLTLVHVIEGRIKDFPHLAIQVTEKRLRETIPAEPELLYEPEVVLETGAAGDRILRLATDLAADMIVMGVRGAGAFAQTGSRFGSIAHKVVSLAACPVLTIGADEKRECT